MVRFIFLLVLGLSGPASFSQVLPANTVPSLRIDSLPESQIDIPIEINLRPVFQLAESSVDTVFTSPGYPDGWIQEDCATRYKYFFRRSPLWLKASGMSLNLGFTGFYKIIGSTRVCTNGVVLSPWTSECRCGFTEGERKVNVNFFSSFQIQPNYLLQIKTVRSEPHALDKCEVCFWGQDITKVVMNGLKEELDLSLKAMESSFGKIDLKPYVQQAWDLLGRTYEIPNVGFFSLNPKRLRMNQFQAKDDLLKLNVGITASPVISFENPVSSASPLPDLSRSNSTDGFNIFLEASLQYDSLTNVLNSYLTGKRFELSEGLIKKHMIVKNARVGGDLDGNLIIDLDFEGSHKGSIRFAGKPVYNKSKKTIEIPDLDYDLKTNDLLLKTVKWLFNKKIVRELRKYTVFNLESYYESASKNINSWLNKEWTRGISGAGNVSRLELSEVHAQPEHLVIRTNCSGKLSVKVNEISLKL